MTDISFENLGYLPVPGETPAGDNARYEPEYSAVLEEIEKLSFSGQGAAVSWPAIEKNAVAILSEKSKDFQIAAYLGVALCRTRGFDGLLDGLRTLTGLMENYWETGWPPLKRMRGRAAAIDWWHERVHAFLRDAQDTPVSRREELLEALGRLDGLVSSLMPDASPLRDLTAAAQRLPAPVSAKPEPPAQALPVPAPAAAAPAKAPEPPAPPVAPQEATPPPTDDPLVLRRHFVAAGQAYIAAARRAEPGDPAHWRLSRLIVWGGIAALPASENGQTLLPAPDMNALDRARLKLRAGRALEAAFEAEDFFTGAPFCLDAQELVHSALAALRFAEAARVVQEESARFFARLPGLEALSFIDGAPFASPRVAAWLRDTAAPKNLETAAPAAGGGEALVSARELMAQNKLVEALAALDAAKTFSPAANLRLRACQVSLLGEGGEFDAAQALAEDLLQETTARALDDWDPPLALEALAAVRGAFALNEARYAEELREVRRRLARLRPAAALG